MRTLSTISLLCCAVFTFAQQAFNGGQLTVSNVAKNAVRVQFTKGEVKSDLPDWLYVKHETVDDCDLKVTVDKKRKQLIVKDRNGKPVFTALRHHFENGEAFFQLP